MREFASSTQVSNSGLLNENREEISLIARRLLESPSAPVTVSQYCYPNGACDLSDVYDGVSGFVLQGEAATDYSGISVSTAGDVNGDGVADLLIGARLADPSGRSQAGKSYVVFGSRNSTAWGTGTLDLSSLINGVRGFVLQGEAASDYSGSSVSAAGDINGDGVADLVIGAPDASPSGRSLAGKSYVVFGSRNSTSWGAGTLDLSNLINGIRGFVLQGETAGDISGSSVSVAGDINGDGVDDLVIGAPQASLSIGAYAGKSYVVFGSRNSTAWGAGTLDLSSLINGVRGFVLQGEAASDFSGSSVSAAGDINGDGVDDLVIGAPPAGPSSRGQAGKSYVVFGSRNSTAWGTGTLNLNSLINGVRGFVLQGEAASDYSGCSVSAAGDVNGDGVTDLLIGANAADKSYVVFGSRNSTAWGTGTLDLSSLINGVRGFVLQGEVAGDQSGNSVSAAGDMNGDGVADLLIGAHLADPNGRSQAGKSYVVFGSRNSTAWGNGTVNLSSLMNGMSGFVLQGEAAGDRSGYSVSAAGDVNGDGVPDLLIGAYQADPSGRNLAGKSYVVFGPLLQFSANNLRLAAGDIIRLNTSMLAVTNNQVSVPTRFDVEILTHGGFTVVNGSNSQINSFYVQDVGAGEIQFIHDGSLIAPTYRLSSKTKFFYSYSDAQIDFLGAVPVLVSNQLFVDQGLATVLQSADISASDLDNSPGALQFVVSNIQHGQFNIYNATGQLIAANVSQFSQQAVFEQQLQFIHDGSSIAPSYAVAVSDTHSTTNSRAAIITFNQAPLLFLNPLIIDQGQATTLLSSDISATDAETFNEDLIIEVSNVTHGHFSYTSNANLNITAFRQFPLITGAVQFTQDGSNANASFALRAFDGRIYSAWQMAQTRLNHRPLLQANITDKTVTQGKAFHFDLDTGLFVDPDGEALNYTAQLEGGAPLPKGVEFIPPTRFQGELSTLSSLQIEVQARDPRGLKATAGFGLDSQAPTQSGINLQQLYTAVSSIGGIAVAIGGYLWWRHKLTDHRRGFELANNLRKAANLEYHDFMRFDGDVFKSKIENLLINMDMIQKGFYKGLTPVEKKSFAVCLAEILEQHKLLKPSDYGMGIYGLLFAFSVGWSQQLDFKKFGSELDEIAREALTAWQAEASPTSRWPYFSPTMKDKVKACCGARPSRAGMFAQHKVRLSRTEGVSLTDLKSDGKHQVIDVSSSSRKDVLAAGFFNSSATSDERLVLIEKQVQSLSGSMQEMRREMAVNVKTIHDEVEQLKAEARPLLTGLGMSSSS